jgi:hypothetical protein
MTEPRPRHPWSRAALIVALLAVVGSIVHTFAGPIEPTRPLGQRIADTAVEAGRAMAATSRGETPPPPAPRWDPDRVVDTATMSAGALAIVLVLVAWTRGERGWVAAVAGELGVVAAMWPLFLLWAALGG